MWHGPPSGAAQETNDKGVAQIDKNGRFLAPVLAAVFESSQKEKKEKKETPFSSKQAVHSQSVLFVHSNFPLLSLEFFLAVLTFILWRTRSCVRAIVTTLGTLPRHLATTINCFSTTWNPMTICIFCFLAPPMHSRIKIQLSLCWCVTFFEQLAPKILQRSFLHPPQSF